MSREPSLLEQAIAEARAEGIIAAADALEAVATTAYTTSSELIGEHRRALTQFLKATHGRLQASTRAKLDVYLAEIGARR